MSELPPDGAPWPAAVAAIAALLDEAYGALVEWCGAPATLLDQRPAPGAWTGREVLEHVHLTDHFLFVLADKLAARSARRAGAGEAWPARDVRLRHLERLLRRELRWEHPEHMTPSGEVPSDALARDLAADLARARALLTAMPAGEGTLHTITMSVVGEKLDLYQYVALIGLHARRHVGQLERNAGGRLPG